jgi:D-alanyl-D-alanine dipeptidase
MPYLAKLALDITIKQLQKAYKDAVETGNHEDFMGTIDNFSKMAKAAGNTKLKKKFRDQ